MANVFTLDSAYLAEKRADIKNDIKLVLCGLFGTNDRVLRLAVFCDNGKFDVAFFTLVFARRKDGSG